MVSCSSFIFTGRTWRQKSLQKTLFPDLSLVPDVAPIDIPSEHRQRRSILDPVVAKNAGDRSMCLEQPGGSGCQHLGLIRIFPATVTKMMNIFLTPGALGKMTPCNTVGRLWPPSRHPRFLSYTFKPTVKQDDMCTGPRCNFISDLRKQRLLYFLSQVM